MRNLLILAVAAFAIFVESIADNKNDALRAVAQSVNEFSVNFLKTVVKETLDNLISSPLSAEVVLAMAAYGAGRTTASQMRSGLHIPAGDDEFNLSGYKSLIETMNAVDGVNVVYFKGKWEQKFNPMLTTNRDFHIDAQTTKTVSTMSVIHNFCSRNLPEVDARFIELPYRGEEASMIIILPNQVDELKQVHNNLHQLNLTKNLRLACEDRIISLHLSKFKIESTLDLKGTFEKMGMTDMFQRGANFSGITDTSLKVTKVDQKAFIEVNEEGSEVAAESGDLIVPGIFRRYYGRVVYFEVDRPFVYAIRHTASGTTLFSGLLTDP